MKSMQIIGANVKLSKHDGDGEIHAILEGKRSLQTCWTPTPEELENLNAGGYVRVVVECDMSGMSLDCIHPFPPD